MNLEKLYKMQTALDQHIEEKHQLTSEDLVDRKILALLVEIGELANETRCFKFWSTKPASDKSVILEEFVDGIHFILSLGIESEFQIEEIKVSQESRENGRSTSEQFLEVYKSINEFRTNRTEKNYLTMFQEYLILARLLDFSEKEIEQAYIEKNEVNYERQQKGY
ncbi:dUTP diphosphatase [Mesobacillus maritimus]|uniref:dUTP diphosphatase n=1 Tax=Mesobacillus maritimus TaxID=1643336 RepID=UPI00203A44C9|nr:dUTP diphosphatase [Mesobacillus maritimus]MCM3587591.1 dUTP diphosphatase [Mesobacillus maritimus]MCM3669836.1 dUTP diphosphatase [Mesobacillus maritimus]